MNGSSENQVQDFSRYEFKYLLPLHLRETIEAEVQQFMRYDGFVNPDLENQYLVRSLYLDNADASNFYEKVDGLKTRRKYRLRTYTTDIMAPSPLFLEMKGRHNQRTYKHRVQLAPDDLPLILQRDRHFGLLERYRDIPLIETFVFDVSRKQLHPRVLVDYRRRPYTSHFDINFRVTFDQTISAMAADRLFPTEVGRFHSCVAGWTILEVKFNRRIPAWFHRILQAHELRNLSISKFVVGMKTCGLATDLS
jgi:hypothetical protein